MSKDKQNSSEQDFVAQISEALDASVDRIDADMQQKLNAARRHALSQQKQKVFLASSWNKAIFATALSILVAVLVVKTQFPSSTEQGLIEEESIEALELIAAQDALDMYEELEFYSWLVDEDVTT